ncbi:MAG: hypothetical protein NTV74_02645 [Euryarchaeota archaeon]|nr:hypothetical protein [Euryarchaeota archaeon]
MKLNLRKIIFPAFVLTILLIPTVSASASQNANINNDGVFYAIYANAGKITLSIANYRNESLNYSFIVVYGSLRISLITGRSPRVIIENGTIATNSSFEKTYRVRFSFSPIAAVLQVDNTSLICTGYVFGKRVIFRATAVIDGLISFI